MCDGFAKRCRVKAGRTSCAHLKRCGPSSATSSVGVRTTTFARTTCVRQCPRRSASRLKGYDGGTTTAGKSRGGSTLELHRRRCYRRGTIRALRRRSPCIAGEQLPHFRQRDGQLGESHARGNVPQVRGLCVEPR